VTILSRVLDIDLYPFPQVGLAGHLAGRSDERTNWKYVWEFLEECRWEPASAPPRGAAIDRR